MLNTEKAGHKAPLLQIFPFSAVFLFLAAADVVSFVASAKKHSFCDKTIKMIIIKNLLKEEGIL